MSAPSSSETSEPAPKNKNYSIMGTYRFVVEIIHEVFEANMPFETVNELDWKYILFFGMALYSCYFALFAYFMASDYISSINNDYLSASHDSNCDFVPIVTSGTYLGDTEGNWEGTNAFSYSLSVYEIVLSGFSVPSKAHYSDMIYTFQGAFEKIANGTQDFGITYSLLAWMSFIRYYSVDEPELTDFSSLGYGKLQYMTLHGSPATVFNLGYTQIAIGSENGSCNATAEVENSPSLFHMSAIYDKSQYENTIECMNAVTPDYFDLYSAVNDHFSLIFDTRTFITALAVNYGIHRIKDLPAISSVPYYITVNETTYSINQYIDLRYAGMDPIICIRNTTATNALFNGTTPVCAILKGTNTIALPVFNHAGNNNMTYPAYCGPDVVSQLCDQFRLMSGMVFFTPSYKAETYADVETLIMEQFTNIIIMLQNGGYSSYFDFNKAAYNASFLLSALERGTLDETYNTAEFYQESFNFCRIGGSSSDSTACSMIMFFQYDYYNNFVNPYFYRLINGSLSNGISLNNSHWDKFANTPPVTIVESYYECRPTVLETIQQSQGIASGNIQMAMMFIIPLIFAPCVYCLIYNSDTNEFNTKHKKLATDQLMDILLHIMKKQKDGVDPSEMKGVDRDGVLVMLARELQNYSAAYEDDDMKKQDAVDAAGDGAVVRPSKHTVFGRAVELSRERSKKNNRKNPHRHHHHHHSHKPPADDSNGTLHVSNGESMNANHDSPTSKSPRGSKRSKSSKKKNVMLDPDPEEGKVAVVESEEGGVASTEMVVPSGVFCDITKSFKIYY